jgi:sugar phosphate isomerase/epimerase
MKLGINTAFIMTFDVEDGLRFAANLGMHVAEVATCGIAFNNKYCRLDQLTSDEGELHRWQDTYARHGIKVVSLSAHGAPLTPNKEIADEYRRQFRLACQFAERIGVKKMTLIAGTPEGAEGDTCPVWITQQVEVPFYRKILEWQWEKRLIPYWKEQGKIAADHGVTLCFENQVGDMLHSPVQIRRFHEEIGAVSACNFDISHIWAQGMDPIEALRYLGDLVQHVHIKDTLIHNHNLRLKGFTDSTYPTKPLERAYTFTIPGWGHDDGVWREVIATLRLISYDDILSMEMECEYMNIEEGLKKAVAFLNPIVLETPIGKRWWQVAEFSELWKED